MWKTSLLDAIQICGTQTAFAERLSAVMRKAVSQQQVSYWLNKAQRFEAEYCLPIQYVTDGKVKASAFRPDVFLPSLFDGMPLEKIVETIETLNSPARATG